jgi:hypothetical protein
LSSALNLQAGICQSDSELLVIESATTQFTRYHVAYNGCDCLIQRNLCGAPVA